MEGRAPDGEAAGCPSRLRPSCPPPWASASSFVSRLDGTLSECPPTSDILGCHVQEEGRREAESWRELRRGHGKGGGQSFPPLEAAWELRGVRDAANLRGGPARGWHRAAGRLDLGLSLLFVL